MTGELRRPRLVARVVREVGSDALWALLDEADERGVSLAQIIEARCEEIRTQLVRDAAPKALRELRRVTPAYGSTL